jgi:hypothetical protein
MEKPDFSIQLAIKAIPNDLHNTENSGSYIVNLIICSMLSCVTSQDNIEQTNRIFLQRTFKMYKTTNIFEKKIDEDEFTKFCPSVCLSIIIWVCVDVCVLFSLLYTYIYTHAHAHL